MSATATAPTGRSAENRDESMMVWLVGGISAAIVVALIAIALWPASDADKARDDGEALGAAVGQLYNAESADEVDSALVEVRDAAVDARDRAGDAVGDHVADQSEAFERAVEGYNGSTTTSDDFEASLYQEELDVAVADLESQAADFREQGSEVQQAFWEGIDSGLAQEGLSR